jgi:hypothetical protein
LEAVPRLDSQGGFIESLADVLRKKPHTVYLAFERDIAERTEPKFQGVKFSTLIAAAPASASTIRLHRPSLLPQACREAISLLAGVVVNSPA